MKLLRKERAPLPVVCTLGGECYQLVVRFGHENVLAALRLDSLRVSEDYSPAAQICDHMNRYGSAASQNRSAPEITLVIAITSGCEVAD